jgi:hypothetical protein
MSKMRHYEEFWLLNRRQLCMTGVEEAVVQLTGAYHDM